ncbi:MAG: hypothetical protein LBR08_01095 [Bacteroidales bacterium]|nr:hypothetical protein [Bacteroidales bacterium]
MFVLFLQSVAGQELYVSVSGDDANDGTSDKPLATLTGARDRIRLWRRQGIWRDAIFVKIMPGMYSITEPLTLTGEDSGTASSPVIYTSATEEHPVICGGMVTGTFEAVKQDLWRVRIPETRCGFSFEQMYINDGRRFRAQTPNRGSFLKIAGANCATWAACTHWALPKGQR